jgi:c(7)-type cytochrome triheme protein
MKLKALFFVAALACLLPVPAGAARGGETSGFYSLPALPPPEEYGNVLMNGVSEQEGVMAVGFSHWRHRMKYTCRVCHFELEFGMKAGTTGVTEQASRSGRYCGACHDGVTAFGHTEPNCPRCHNGGRANWKERFDELTKGFPKTGYGSGIDWVKAVRRGFIKPKNHLGIRPPLLPFNRMLWLDAEMHDIPAAVFSHKSHKLWLDCNNCHPDIFNIKKKNTKHFSMSRNLKGEFCGVCHMTVAFPLDDCFKCHPRAR